MARTQRKKTTSKRSSSRRTTRRSKKRSPKFLGMNRSQWAIIFGITLIALSVIAILGGLSISKGQVTERMWEIIWVTFGLAGVAVPILIGALGLFLVLWGMDQPPGVPWSKLVGLFMLFLGIESALHNIYLMRNPTLSATTDTALRRGGGYVGAVLNSLLESAAGSVGALVLAIALSVGGLFVLTGWSLVKWLQRPDQRKARVRRAAIKPSTKPARKPVRSKPEIRSQAKPATTKKPPKKEPKPETTPTPMKSSEPGLFYGDAVLMASAGYSWKLPIMEEILDESSEARAADARIREQVDIIEQTLASFGAPPRGVEVNPGPVITQHGVEPQYLQQRNGRRVKAKVG
ncbi:MAG: DNA translocase FtsK 4TM domain-containing protein, partial [Chloroflexota bacterium]